MVRLDSGVPFFSTGLTNVKKQDNFDKFLFHISITSIYWSSSLLKKRSRNSFPFLFYFISFATSPGSSWQQREPITWGSYYLTPLSTFFMETGRLSAERWLNLSWHEGWIRVFLTELRKAVPTSKRRFCKNFVFSMDVAIASCVSLFCAFTNFFYVILNF